MGKYIGPRVKITRRLGLVPGFTQKNSVKRRKTPGQHGILLYKQPSRTLLSEDYKYRLLEKQKLRFNYGITEKQLVLYYTKAKKIKGSTGLSLIQILESRLDCILYRSGFVKTITMAKQLISHGHFCVNNIKITIPSFLCKIGDVITLKEDSTLKSFILKMYEERHFFTNNLLQKLQKRYLLNRLHFDLQYKNILQPSHLFVNKNTVTVTIISLIKRDEVFFNFNELKIIEFYSR